MRRDRPSLRLTRSPGGFGSALEQPVWAMGWVMLCAGGTGRVRGAAGPHVITRLLQCYVNTQFGDPPGHLVTTYCYCGQRAPFSRDAERREAGMGRAEGAVLPCGAACGSVLHPGTCSRGKGWHRAGGSHVLS